jgi:hypothetical protein
MSKNRQWVLCNSCENWQPVREKEIFIDLEGYTWQACEFCERDDGPTIIEVDGQTYTTEQLSKEEVEEYEQRNSNK